MGAGRAQSSPAVSDPGCVKTLRGITTPGILGPVVMRRAKKRKNLSSARHYDQIRFRFHTTKTQSGHWLCAALGAEAAPIQLVISPTFEIGLVSEMSVYLYAFGGGRVWTAA